MEIERKATGISGCYELQPRLMHDARGAFVKIFHSDTFRQLNLRTDWAEQYYSVSRPGVLRGLHFQLPPRDHAKLVYCTSGRIMDVAVDLRKGSPSYGRFVSIELSAKKGNAIYLPSGLAHGFCTFNMEATLIYNVTSVYEKTLDAGVRWDSVGIDWPVGQPVVSERDESLPCLRDFSSPFIFKTN